MQFVYNTTEEGCRAFCGVSSAVSLKDTDLVDCALRGRRNIFVDGEVRGILSEMVKNVGRKLDGVARAGNGEFVVEKAMH